MAFENLEARLRLDHSQFEKATDRASRSMEGLAEKSRNMGRRMQGMGTKLALGATLPLVGMGAGAIKAASDVEEMQSKMSVVFGDLTGDIEDWAAAQAEATGRSKFQFQEMATALGDTFKPMGFGKKEAASMSKEVATLATDLASFNNMDTTEAMNRLRGGLIGNHENLREFGVMINQSTLGEQLEEMFGKGVQAATEQEKMLARLAIVQEGTADAQGDAARTADSFANQYRSLKADVRELAVVFGRELMPAARDLIAAIKPAIQWFKNLDTRWRRIIVVGAALVAALGPVLIFFGTLLTVLPAVAGAAGTLAAVVGALSLPVLAVAAAVAALAIAWQKDFLGIRTAVTKAVKSIMSNLQPLIDMIGPEFTATINHWKNVIRDALAVVEAWWSKHGEKVMSVVGPLFEGIRLVVENALDALITAVRVALAILRGDWKGAFEIMSGFADRQMERFKEIGRNLIEAVANGVRIAGDAVEGAIDDVLSDVREYLPFSDAKKGPLSDLKASGKALPGTFAEGVASNTDAIARERQLMAERARPGGGAGGVSVGQLRQALSGLTIEVRTGDEALDRVIENKAEIVVGRHADTTRRRRGSIQ